MEQESRDIAIVDPQSLISQAIETNLPVEQMERLLAMRKELNAEYAEKSYFVALSNFQQECPVIEKKAKVMNRDGKSVRYKYATLDHIVASVKELLQKYGFSYVIKAEQTDDSVAAICESHHRDGHVEVTKFAVPIMKSEYMNYAQSVASALTFTKRYAFCNAFGILTGDEDDDTQSLGSQTEPKNKTNKTFANAPEENKGVYSSIMALIRMNALTNQEKASYKKNADAVLYGELKNIENLRDSIEKIVKERTGGENAKVVS